VKRRVGYLPDSVGFYGNMTGRENLRYTARLNGLAGEEAEEAISLAVEHVGLTDRADTRTDTYSRGMLQRLGIADALLKDPDVLILDEPTASIDPIGVDVLRLLASSSERGSRSSRATSSRSSHCIVGIAASASSSASGPCPAHQAGFSLSRIESSSMPEQQRCGPGALNGIGGSPTRCAASRTRIGRSPRRGPCLRPPAARPRRPTSPRPSSQLRPTNGSGS
jgi:hypothetical protein